MRRGYRLIGLLTVMVAVSLAYADDYLDDVYYWPGVTTTVTQTQTETQTQTKTTTEREGASSSQSVTVTTTTTPSLSEGVSVSPSGATSIQFIQVQDTVVKAVIRR